MKTAAAYIRVSDDRQDEYSPDSQLKLIKEYAKRNDFDIPEQYVFYDDGISGRSVKRRVAFNNMIACAKSKEHPFEAILVWKFSRFARNQEESIVYKSMLRRINVSVISVSETIDDSPFAPLIERIIEFMDEYYSTRLSQEVKRGMTEKASRGEAMCRGAFGYTLKGKKYYPNENADTVRWIFQSYLSGKGVRKIAKELSEQGIKTPRGNAPDNRFVDYILRNPVYTGKIRWSTSGRSSADRYLKSNDDIMIVDGNHEAIIDFDTFNRVQEQILETKKKFGKYQRQSTSDFMLRGLIRCSNCGATLSQAKKGVALQCHKYAKGQCDVSHYLRIDKANEIIISALKESLRTLNFNVIPKQTTNSNFIDYDALIEKEQAKIKRASDAYDSGFDSLEEYGRKKKAYQKQIKNLLEKKKQQKTTQNPLSKDFINKVKQTTDYIQNPDISPSAKNEALRSIIDHIVYDKGSQELKIFFYM